MKTLSRNLTAGALAIAGSTAFGLGSIAQAAQLNANLGFIPIGATTYTGATLSAASAIDFANTNLVNLIPTTYTPPGGSSAPNSFYSGPIAVTSGSAVTLSPDPLSIGASGSITFTVGLTTAAGPATFTSTSFTRSSSGANFLDLSFIGSISGTGFDTTAAGLLLNLNQQGGVGNGVNYSATLTSPPANASSVPEPSAVLGLLGVAGMTAFARRRRQG